MISIGPDGSTTGPAGYGTEVVNKDRDHMGCLFGAKRASLLARRCGMGSSWQLSSSPHGGSRYIYVYPGPSIGCSSNSDALHCFISPPNATTRSFVLYNKHYCSNVS